MVAMSESNYNSNYQGLFMINVGDGQMQRGPWHLSGDGGVTPLTSMNRGSITMPNDTTIIVGWGKT